MKTTLNDEESRIIKSHEERMASKIVERERKLVEHAMRSRRRAQDDNVAKISRGSSGDGAEAF